MKYFRRSRRLAAATKYSAAQKLLTEALADVAGIQGVDRSEIKTNVLGVNHFTWLDSAYYHNQDLFPDLCGVCGKVRGEGIREGRT